MRLMCVCIYSHDDDGSYLVGAKRFEDEFADTRLLLAAFKYSSSLSRTTSGLSLALYVRQRFMNVYNYTIKLVVRT